MIEPDELAVASDAELLKAARTDPDAFRQVYERYAPRLHAFFARRTGSDDVALDLTAETFAQAWSSRHRFRDRARGSAGPWLFAIGRHVLIGAATKRRLETTALERLNVDLRFSDAAGAAPDERWLDGLNTDIEAALEALPPEQRRAVELRVLSDLPYAGIAGRLGCTPTAVRIRVSRGLATLRARLEEGRG